MNAITFASLIRSRLVSTFSFEQKYFLIHHIQETRTFLLKLTLAVLTVIKILLNVSAVMFEAGELDVALH